MDDGQTVNIEQIAAHAVADLELGEWSPKPTALTPGVQERLVELWSVPGIDVGVWECTPGSFSARRDTYSETCVLVTGHVTLVDELASIDYRAGDVLVTPQGWVGVWHVHETVRKVYVINSGKQ